MRATVGRPPAGRRVVLLWAERPSLRSVKLRIVPAAPDLLEEWRAIHNAVIPTAPLSSAEVADRATRNRLTVAYDSDVLVGNATVRPPSGDTGAAVVIVRILPEHRRGAWGRRTSSTSSPRPEPSSRGASRLSCWRATRTVSRSRPRGDSSRSTATSWTATRSRSSISASRNPACATKCNAVFVRLTKGSNAWEVIGTPRYMRSVPLARAGSGGVFSVGAGDEGIVVGGGIEGGLVK